MAGDGGVKRGELEALDEMVRAAEEDFRRAHQPIYGAVLIEREIDTFHVYVDGVWKGSFHRSALKAIQEAADG